MTLKLKLENQDGISILIVTEDLKSAHIPVLKAGLSKLFQSGTKSIVLDLTALPSIDPLTARDLNSVVESSFENDGQLGVVTAASDIAGSNNNRAEAIATLKSPTAYLKLRETRLSGKKARLEKIKTDLSGKLSSSQGQGDIQSIRRENSQFRSMIKEIETELVHLVQARNTQKSQSAGSDYTENVHKTIQAVLETQGVLVKK